MKIDSIQNGIVLDHITAGKALQVYHDLELDKLDCSVAILQNVKSSKMGKKDILKIDKEYDVNLDGLHRSRYHSQHHQGRTDGREKEAGIAQKTDQCEKM